MVTARDALRPRCACAAAAIALLLAAPAVAQTNRYWAPAAGAGGSGTWNNTDLFWAPNADGSGTKVAWNSTLTNNVAYFGGTAGTVTTGAAVSTNQIRFDTTGYLLAGDATNTITLNGTTPQVLLADGVTAEISAALAGSAGFSTGASGTTGGTLTLSGISTLTGTVGIGAGQTVLATAGSLTAGTLDVGTGVAGATSTLRIKSGASMSFSAQSTVGTNSRPTAAVIQEGGTASFGGALLLGTNGGSTTYTGSSSYTMEGGVLNLTNGTNSFVTVGRNTTATFTQIGGTVTISRTSDALTIGDYASGTYTLTGGTMSAIGDPGSHVLVGHRGGSGTLSVNGADALVRIRGSLMLANNDANLASNKGSATVTLAQGTLAVNGILKGRQVRSNGYGDVTFTLSGGTLRPYSGNVSFGSSTVDRNFDITLSGTAGTISGLDASATPVARTVDLYANLIGSGGLTLSGGTINLRGANTYSGGTTIAGSTVNVLATSAVPATGSYTILSGGTFADSSGFATVGGWLASGRIATASAGTLAFTAATSTDAINLTGYDSLILATTGTTEVSGAFTPAATGLRIGGTGTLTISSAIGGSAGLTKTGTGTLVLSGSNTFPGTTTISAGTLEAASAAALGNGGQIAFAGGTLRYGSGVSTDFSGRISPTAGQNVQVDVGGQTVEWATGLAGTGTVLTRSGAGTLTLTAANTHTGGTTLTGAGETVVAATGSLTGPGSILIGTGSGTSSLRIASGATVSAGSLRVGTNTNQNAAVIQEGGDVTASAVLRVGGESGTTAYVGSATYDLQGGSITLTGSAPIQVGRNSPATFTQSGGTVTIAATNTTAFTIGNYSSGTYTLTGGSLTAASTGANLTLATNSGGNGTLTINGPTARMGLRGTGTLASGGSTATATVNLQQGELAINGLSRGNSAGVTNFNLAGGTLRPFNANVTYGSASADNNFDVTLTGSGSVISGLDAAATPVARTVDLYANLVGSGGVTLSGGTINLQGTNTYSGGTTIGAGTAAILATSAVPASGTYTILSGGTLADSSGFATVGGWLASGRIATASAGTLAFTAATESDPINLTGYDSLVLAATGTTEVSGTVTPSATGLRIGGTGTLTISSAVGGPAGLTKTGNGTLVLSGANTYQGATTLAAGTLTAGSATALGTGGTISFGGGTLGYAAGVSTDFSGRFATGPGQAYAVDTGGEQVTWATPLDSSGGSLTKLGTGTLTLSGASSYDGGTTLSAGGLNLGSATALGTGTFTISAGTLGNSSGGPLALTTNNPLNLGSFTFAGPHDLNLGTGAGTLAATRTVTVSAATLTLGGVISGAGGLTKEGTGRLVLTGANTFAGAVTVSGGELTLAGGTLAGNATRTVGSATGPASVLRIQAGSSVGAGSFLVGNATIPNATVIQEGGDLTVSTALQLANSGLASTYAGNSTYELQGGSITFTGTGFLQVGRNATSSFTQSGGTITIAATGSSLIVGDYAAGTYTMTAGSLTATAAGGNLVLGNRGGAGTLTINGPTARMAFNGAGRFAINDSSTTGSSATVNLLAGELALNSMSRVSSAGTVNFTLGGGTLRPYGANATFGSATAGNNFSITLSGTGSVISGLDAAATPVARTVDLHTNLVGAGGLTLSGGTINLRGTNTYAGGTTITGGTVAISTTAALPRWNEAGGFSVAGGSGLAVGSGVTNADVATLLGTGNFAANTAIGFDTSAGDRTYSAAIADSPAGPLGVVKLGTGALVLSGASGFTGPTTLVAGTLEAASAAALGNGGAISFAGGTLRYGSSVTTDFSNRFSTAAAEAYRVDTAGQNVTWATPLVSAAGSLQKTGTGTLTLTTDATFSGTTTISGGTLQLGGGGTAGTVAGGIVNSGLLVVDRSDDITLGGVISGAGGLTKQGTGRLMLSGANSFTGAVTVAAGELTVAGGGLAGSGTRTVGSATGPASVLRIQAGSTVAASTFAIGNATIPNAAVIQEGGDVTVSTSISMASTGAAGTYAGSSTYELQSGSMTFTGSAFLQVARNATSSFTQSGGTITLARAGDALIVGDYAAGSYTISAGSLTATSAGGNLVLGNRGGSGTLTINGPTARMGFNGAGRFAINDSSTTGSSATVNLLAGELALNGMSRLSSTGDVAFTLGGGTLRPYGADVVFGSATANNNFEITLSGSGSVISGLDASATPVARNVFLRTPLVGSGGVTLSGGTITLQSANTHAGPTSIAPGTSVTLNGSFANSAAVTVNGSLSLAGKTTGFAFGSGQTLGGAGTIALPTTGPGVSLAGFVSPGNSPGTLTLSGAGTFDITSAINGNTARLLFELGAPIVSSASDLVLVPDGTLAIGTNLLGFDSFAFTPLAGFGPGTYTLFTANSISGGLDPARTTGSLGGLAAELTATTTEISLVVVPEPAAIALAGAAAVSLIVLGIRRRRGR
jgi:autotransporter-associated beta strand protein